MLDEGRITESVKARSQKETGVSILEGTGPNQTHREFMPQGWKSDFEGFKC